jgi:hypothetical protein
MSHHAQGRGEERGRGVMREQETKSSGQFQSDSERWGAVGVLDLKVRYKSSQ